MGAWGAGLYSNDCALDLRATIKGVARLPFTPDKLLGTVCATDSSAANDPNDPDHTTFWLTVADQFAKRGIDCPVARDRALAIIADGTDLDMMSERGMDEKSLAKRRSKLDELAAFLRQPVAPKKSRAVLKAPQKFSLEVGDVLTYPTCKGNPINPYAVGKEWAWVKAWKQDAAGVAVIVERGLVFEFLAWYRPLVLVPPLRVEPTMATITGPHTWRTGRPGTLSLRHRDAMRITNLSRIAIDPAKLARVFGRVNPVFVAVSDVSLGDGLSVPDDTSGLFAKQEAHRIRNGYPPLPKIGALSEITAAL